MIISEIIQKYLSCGNDFNNAQKLTAQEIFIRKISSSPFSELITLKGGIVMYNLSNKKRGVTQDLDFDFIRYSIKKDAIDLFIKKLNSLNDGIQVKINGAITNLNHESYNGIRINVILSDSLNDKVRIKLDIGVHNKPEIEQETLLFCFETNNKSLAMKVNSCEQIFIEKLMSLSKFGIFSTRYKDIYDIYFLISNSLLDFKKVTKYLKIISDRSGSKGCALTIIKEASLALNNSEFLKEIDNSIHKWIEVDVNDMCEIIQCGLRKIEMLIEKS